ncbi:hypothetical protein ABEB36_006551 [Hypothenemus hampei]|uniref:Uncharacterized protein n=1 Tax=Hypothenemus hampei TaxID=57062 RepID=A0ABD1ERE2_HYPHA
MFIRYVITGAIGIVISHLICQSVGEGTDLLQLFKPNPDVPQDLNDFLIDVQQHKKDFAFIRNAVTNRQKYEKSFQESHELFANDIEDQMTKAPEFKKKETTPDKALFDLSEGFETAQPSYSEERYSKFIHSPVRLRRESRENFLNRRVQIKSDYGNIDRAEFKFPSRNFPSAIQRPKKRDIEINIKSDGKLVKHIEEEENGPKSIILNIKAKDSKCEEEIITPKTPLSSKSQEPNRNLDTSESIPTFNKYKNNSPNYHVGVPINSIPAGSSDNRDPMVKAYQYMEEIKPAADFQLSPEKNNLYEGKELKNNFDLKFGKNNEFEKVQGLIVDESRNKPYLTKRGLDAQQDTLDYIEPLGENLGTTYEHHEHHEIHPMNSIDTNVHMNHEHPYEIIEKSTKRILVIPIHDPTTPCPEMEHEKEAEEIGKAIAEDIIKEEESGSVYPEEEREYKIVKRRKNGREGGQEEVEILREELPQHHHHRSKRFHKTHHSSELRNRKHLPSIPKYKRKKVRQHQKKRPLDETEYYDLNAFYKDSVPAYQRRQLKSVNYEFDPTIIQDIGNRQEQEIEDFVQHLQHEISSPRGIRKKMKTDGDYSEEEDSMASNTKRKVPVKKTKNQFAAVDVTTTEDNDDDYDYANLSDMEDENEDISYEEVDSDKLGDMEETSDNRSQEVDRFVKEDEVSTVISLKPNEMLAGVNGHGRGSQKRKKSTKKNSMAMSIPEELSLKQTFNNQLRSKKPKLHSQLKQKKNQLKKVKRENEQPSKRMTAEKKEDIFLKYNPDFQRWPRFVREDQNFYQSMRERAATANRQRLSKHSAENFPISNEYVINAHLNFKRQESSTFGTTTRSTEVSTSSEESLVPSQNLFSLNMDMGVVDTLPQSALNILHTANSDIFENTTVPGFNMAVSIASVSEEQSTPFQFTTIAEDLTMNTQCDVEHPVPELCDNENAKHSTVILTSVLPLMKESATAITVKLSKEDVLNLDEILVGILPRQVVTNSLSYARGSVRQSLKGNNFNINLLQPSINGSAETNLILTEMSSLIRKLRYHSTCQVLPSNLKIYLKMITKNEMDDPMMKLKEMNELDFDDHQSNYVFHNDKENIEDKASILKELLNKYNQLPQDCKERAEPVKEYIETHLAMVEHLSGKSIKKTPSTTTPMSSTKLTEESEMNGNKSKKEINGKDKLESDLEKEGMDNQKSNANGAIESQKNKRAIMEEATYTSPQFGKLANAIR